MSIIYTKHLFEEDANRQQLTYELVKEIFPGTAPEAIEYELVQQGLLQRGKLSLALDVWQITLDQLKTLMLDWEGPDTPIYIFPIARGFEKNGVAYKKGICLFISAKITEKELRALLTHEYHHMCRRIFVNEHPTLMDSIIMEGLAEDAVENLFGSDYLSPWTKNYSLDELQNYWESHFITALYQRGLSLHQPFLFGDNLLNLPPWIGYCMGYQIVQSFKDQCGPYSVKELMQINAEDIIDGAGFRRSEK